MFSDWFLGTIVIGDRLNRKMMISDWFFGTVVNSAWLNRTMVISDLFFETTGDQLLNRWNSGDQ